MSLQLDLLAPCQTIEAIRTRLGNLPDGLTETYDEIYNKLDEIDRDRLRQAVKWVKIAEGYVSEADLLSAARVTIQEDCGEGLPSLQWSS